MLSSWAVLALAVSRAAHALTKTQSSAILSSRPEPLITSEAVAILAALFLMLLTVVVLYVKLRPGSPKAASTGARPVVLPLSASQTPPIVMIEVEKKPPQANPVDDAPLAPKAMFAAALQSVPDRMMRLDAGDTIDLVKDADLVDSRKSSDSSDRPFRQFRLHSLSDGDLSLHILDAHADDEHASPLK